MDECEVAQVLGNYEFYRLLANKVLVGKMNAGEIVNVGESALKSCLAFLVLAVELFRLMS